MAKKVIIQTVQADLGPVEEGLPPWMATFADMVTLLLCFFVLLLSFAEQDTQKYREVVGSLQDAFGAKEIREKSASFGEVFSTFVLDDKVLESVEGQPLQSLELRIESLIQSEQRLKDSTGVQPYKDGVLIQIDCETIFEPDTARLTPTALRLLDKVIVILEEQPVNLVVRGHTDNKPIHSARYVSNWELSAARAASALAYITEHGHIPAKRLKAVGYADTRPVETNITLAGRRANQRVEFFFHNPEKEAW